MQLWPLQALAPPPTFSLQGVRLRCWHGQGSTLIAVYEASTSECGGVWGTGQYIFHFLIILLVTETAVDWPKLPNYELFAKHPNRRETAKVRRKLQAATIFPFLMIHVHVRIICRISYVRMYVSMTIFCCTVLQLETSQRGDATFTVSQLQHCCHAYLRKSTGLCSRVTKTLRFVRKACSSLHTFCSLRGPVSRDSKDHNSSSIQSTTINVCTRTLHSLSTRCWY